MELISYDEFKNKTEYEEFIKNNPSTGILKVEAFSAFKAMPAADTQILVTKDFDNYRVIFYEGYTNSSGIIDNIILPAPKSELIADYNNIPKYTIYDLTAINEKYEEIKKYNIGLFGNTKIIQYVKLIPKINIEGGN